MSIILRRYICPFFSFAIFVLGISGGKCVVYAGESDSQSPVIEYEGHTIELPFDFVVSRVSSTPVLNQVFLPNSIQNISVKDSILSILQRDLKAYAQSSSIAKVRDWAEAISKILEITGWAFRGMSATGKLKFEFDIEPDYKIMKAKEADFLPVLNHSIRGSRGTDFQVDFDLRAAFFRAYASGVRAKNAQIDTRESGVFFRHDDPIKLLEEIKKKALIKLLNERNGPAKTYFRPIKIGESRLLFPLGEIDGAVRLAKYLSELYKLKVSVRKISFASRSLEEIATGENPLERTPVAELTIHLGDRKLPLIIANPSDTYEAVRLGASVGIAKEYGPQSELKVSLARFSNSLSKLKEYLSTHGSIEESTAEKNNENFHHISFSPDSKKYGIEIYFSIPGHSQIAGISEAQMVMFQELMANISSLSAKLFDPVSAHPLLHLGEVAAKTTYTFVIPRDPFSTFVQSLDIDLSSDSAQPSLDNAKSALASLETWIKSIEIKISNSNGKEFSGTLDSLSRASTGFGFVHNIHLKFMNKYLPSIANDPKSSTDLTRRTLSRFAPEPSRVNEKSTCRALFQN